MKPPLLHTCQDMSHQPSQEFCDIEYGCYAEEYFHEMLTFERKRSERSGRPFVVMTLDFTGISKPAKRRETSKAAIQALYMLTRSTDIKGWYRSLAVLGVLFTEMNSLETETLVNKINQSLRALLTAEQLGVIRISFHRFPASEEPDDQDGSGSGGDDRLNGSDTMGTFSFYPDIRKKEQARKSTLRIKRFMDITGSIAGILLFSPFFILIPILIKLTSKGPVLFRQERVGQHEKKFMFLKFRSMYVNNDSSVHREYVQSLIANKEGVATGNNDEGQKVFKITNDKRITPLGRILRKTSLDELPQFFNVLKGEMSLAGPRPPIPYELEKYDLWHRRRVLEVKPGITGLWQVYGRSTTTFDEMVRLDLQYAMSWTLWLDIKLILKTPLAIIAGKGAY